MTKNFGIETQLTDIEFKKLDKLIRENKHQAERVIETFKNHKKIYKIINKLINKHKSVQIIASEEPLFWFLGRYWLLSFKIANNEIRYLDISYSDLRLRISISDTAEDIKMIYNPLVIRNFTDWMTIEDLEEFLTKLLELMGVE